MTKCALVHLTQQHRRFSEGRKGAQAMKRWIWAVGGICAAAAGLLVWGSRRMPHVEDLAQDREGTIADDPAFV
jgi:hypothetical protein